MLFKACKVASLAKKDGSNNYTTLVLFTDGEIDDKDQTAVY